MPKGRMLNRKNIPIAVRLFVIKRDKNTCQYCGEKGVFVFRYEKPTVVENPNNIELNEYMNYNGSDIIPFEIDHILARFNGGGERL